MRIAIDFQGAQTGSRFRGIGRYSTELVKALIREGQGHDFVLMLNGLFSETIEPIRAQFNGILSQERIVVWYPVGEPEQFDQDKANVREMSQIIREYAFKAVEPDVILLTSIFEGPGDPAVITVKEYVGSVPTAAVFYDFTPLIIPDEHFKNSALHRFWYRQRIEALKKCDFVFSISESSRDEFHRFIDFPQSKSVNILGGRGREFDRREFSDKERQEKLQGLGIAKPFILYAGGLELNKNLRRLVESLALLPEQIKVDYELVIVGKRGEGDKEKILSWASDGPSQQMLNVVGYVSEDTLIDLYSLCSLFVFPSLREGFGLPLAEAMACGAPAIASDRTSLPEVVANPAALFDPESLTSISAKIAEVLSDQAFRDSLVRHGLTRAGVLTWENCARTLLQTLEQQIVPRQPYDTSRRSVVMQTGKFAKKSLRILTVKLDHNGDFMLGVPAMAKLRARYPDARIDIVIGSWNLEAAKSLGMFDNIYTLDYFKSKSSDLPGLVEKEMDELLAQLPFYDLAIDLRRQPDTRSVFVQLPAAQYYGYDCGDQKIDVLLTNALPRYEEPFAERTPYDSFNSSEQILQIIDQLPFAPTDYITLPAMGERLPVETGSVAIFPRAGNDARQWETERFAALIDRLTANDKIGRIGLYGGRISELETVPFKPNSKITLHAGLRFPDLMKSLSANQVCVGNNSFGVHLGSYAGCRTVGIYSGHELPQHWGPAFGDSYVITADAPCSPCHLPTLQECPYDLFCLKDISVDTVERVILDALEGHRINDNYTKISRANPATTIQPLIQQIIHRKHLGSISELTAQEKTALAAAISVNFPERSSAGRTIYLDVTGLRADTLEAPGRTRSRLEALEALAGVLCNAMAEQDKIVLVATGQRDYEFYSIDGKELAELDQVLLRPDRRNRVVRPIAGDIYLGPDVYTNRAMAQWNLLATWRQNGVRVIMQAPNMAAAPSSQESKEAPADAAYLYKLTHFDAILVPPGQRPVIESWLGHFAPPRLRPLVLKEGGPLSALVKDEALISALLDPAGINIGTQP